MRIACTNHHRKLVGGTESYLKKLLPELARRGHQVSFWHEGEVKPGEAAVDAPEVFRVNGNSPEELAKWKPDVVFNNGLTGMAWEACLPSIAPVVHFAHNYYGTCISGEKTRKFPAARPCTRRFGAACLAQYLPRRCGGLNPFTMWRDYEVQAARLRHLGQCAAIVAASRYIESEYRHHGFTRLYRAPLFVDSGSAREPQAEEMRYRLLFCGRMMRLKGGDLLLDAIPHVEHLLARPVEVIFAGEGPERAAWEARQTKAKFPGWISQQALRDLGAGVLVIPSVWPEPFGMSGLELAIPVAAFAVGGIPDWLFEGVNGHLAEPGDVDALARAIAACLQTPEHWKKLAAGSREVARGFSIERHLETLMPIFESVL